MINRRNLLQAVPVVGLISVLPSPAKAEDGDTLIEYSQYVLKIASQRFSSYSIDVRVCRLGVPSVVLKVDNGCCVHGYGMPQSLIEEYGFDVAAEKMISCIAGGLNA